MVYHMILCKKKMVFVVNVDLVNVDIFTPTYHYIPVNSQKYSRWSINCDIKIHFLKRNERLFRFFEPLRFSDITKLAIKYE